MPSLDALVAYSRAIDLSDQGKVEEAQKAMTALVSKSPTFAMAREKKQALLKSLEQFEERKKDLISGAVLEVNKRAPRALNVMRSWLANQRLLIEEMGQLEAYASADLRQLGLAELFRDARFFDSSSVNFQCERGDGRADGLRAAGPAHRWGRLQRRATAGSARFRRT